MCGIAGWFGIEEALDVATSLSSLKHRGPNGQGSWVSADAGMGFIHTRLAVLDLSDRAHQPMIIDRFGFVLNEDQISVGNADEQSVIVFNGEIYNYQELRTGLEAVGEVFQTDSDTEVLLKLLLREGENCLSKLAGMFAFAFWNRGTHAGNIQI